MDLENQLALIQMGYNAHKNGKTLEQIQKEYTEIREMLFNFFKGDKK